VKLAVTGDATLNNDNQFVSIQGTASNLTVKDTSGDLDLAGVNVGAGTLDVTASGNLTDSAANTAGAVKLAVTGDATLNNDNQFVSIQGTASNLTVKDTSGDLDLAGVNVGAGTLDVTASGNLTDSAANTAGTLTFTASTNVVLDEAGNDFDAVTGTAGGSISLNDVNDVILTSLTTTDGSIEVTAGGTIRADSVAANGANSNAKLTNSVGDIVIGQVTAGSNVCVLSAGSVAITNGTGNITAINGSVAIWAKGGDVVQNLGSIQTGSGNIFLDGSNITQALGARIQSASGNISLFAHNTLNLNGTVDAVTGNLLLEAASIDIASLGALLHAGGTLGLRAGTGSITGAGLLSGTSVALSAHQNIGVSALNRLRVNADKLGTHTDLGNVFIDEADGVESAIIPTVPAGALPPCAAGMHVAAVGSVDYITSADVLDLVVHGVLSGGEIAGSDIVLKAGSINLESLRGGGNANLDVDGDTEINTINVNGKFVLDGGGDFMFDDLSADDVDVVVGGDIAMGQVDAGTAAFKAGGSVNDNNSLLTVGSIKIEAGGDIGSEGAPIKLNTGSIDDISGGNIYLSQSRAGALRVNTINARGYLELLVPHGQILDSQNDGGLQQNAGVNITARNARFDTEQIGERSNPLDVNIPGTIALKNTSNKDPKSSYVWVHISNVANNNQGGMVEPDYTGNIPGLVIQNNQIVGGQDGVMREIFRTEAFFVETPELKSKQGVFGSPYFLHSYLNISEPVALGLIDYVLYGQARVNKDPVMPPEANQTINKGSGGTITFTNAVESFKRSVKSEGKTSPLKNGISSL
jgi:hypothetical protein